ncbi:hypothetical protein AXG93_4855s1050 [Marchantia polymorpha subsp. ruderalis]|uniref:Uncharacterized protein n=1 Tax=Marchantia polymorpha subsp. ruderalis TaxID=1480154 RepID=A0A176VQD4_MARPO|nr:hypothetical protein AXG93_4855s1050 [Marchantia polymorpha subsp. ruderalis]
MMASLALIMRVSREMRLLTAANGRDFPMQTYRRKEKKLSGSRVDCRDCGEREGSASGEGPLDFCGEPYASSDTSDTRKKKGKVIMTKEVPTRRDQVTSAGTRVRVPLEKPAKVLAVSSNIEEDPVALEKIAEKIVENVVGETTAPQ